MNRIRTEKMGMHKKHDHESGFFEDNNLPDEKQKRMKNSTLPNHSSNTRENITKSNQISQKRCFVDDKLKLASTSAPKMRRTDDWPIGHGERSHFHQNDTVKDCSKIVVAEQKCSNSSDVILINDNDDDDRKKCSDESNNYKNKKSRREREDNETYLQELEMASTIRNQSELHFFLIFISLFNQVTLVCSIQNLDIA